jgi:hypothetical protein
MVNGFNDEELEAHVQAEAYEPMDMTRYACIGVGGGGGAPHVVFIYL